MVTKAVMISVALEMMISSECFSTGAADACLTICIDICLWIIEVYFWLPCVLKILWHGLPPVVYRFASFE